MADDAAGTDMDVMETRSVTFQRSSIPYAFQPSFFAVAVALAEVVIPGVGVAVYVWGMLVGAPKAQTSLLCHGLVSPLVGDRCVNVKLLGLHKRS